jgi:hypothetical protein
MSFQITEHFNKLTQPQQVNGLFRNIIDVFQDDIIFHLAYAKAQRKDFLKSIFSGKDKLTIFISDNIRNLSVESHDFNINYLGKLFFSENDPIEFEKKCEVLEGAVVIVNNNDAHMRGNAEGYVRFFNRCTKTLFVIWDWDNHHWLSLSAVLAAHSDIYVPVHPENMYILSRFNSAIAAPVTSGVVQWTSAFLREKAGELLRFPRSNNPLGKHIMYPAFTYRNRMVATLRSHYASIDFSSHQFHALSQEQKLEEWGRHKVHWIIPTLNDLPIRTFDAFVTGGIPLLPESLRFIPCLADVHRNDIMFYTARDIVDPKPLVENACNVFDKCGEAGIIRRYYYGLSKHHGDLRITEIISYVLKTYVLLDS